MFALLFFGLLVGLAVSALRHSYTIRNIVGFTMLAVVGAWEGQLLSGFLHEYHSIPTQLTTSLAIVIGAATLVYLKILFTSKTPHA